MAKTDRNLNELLEPGVEELPSPYDVQMSLAISMKRIADVVSGTEGRYGLADSIRDAIETAILNATRK